MSKFIPFILLCWSCNLLSLSETGGDRDSGADVVETDFASLDADTGSCLCLPNNLETCISLGFVSGELRCDNNCGFDTSKCLSLACNNGRLDDDEACEGFDLRGKTCISEGFQSGELSCTPTCNLNFSDCATCGDGILQTGEKCDANQFGESTCSIENGRDASGQLSCSSDCQDIDQSDCRVILKKLASGFNTACALQSDDKTVCWGRNQNNESSPPDQAFQEISVGLIHGCGITNSRDIVCWGANPNGEASQTGPFISVSTGSDHTCALRVNGTILCWGDNAFGKSTPPLGIYKQISVGWEYACGIKEDKTVRCWGKNSAVNTLQRAKCGMES